MKVADSIDKAMITRYAKGMYYDMEDHEDCNNILRLFGMLNNINDFLKRGDVDTVIEAIDNFLHS